jgi:RNA polymerase sigma-70 factor (ECF subfamily)
VPPHPRARLTIDVLPQLPNEIADARTGSPEALGRLFTEYAHVAFRISLRLTASESEAEDIVQDVFVGLPEALRGYQEQGRFESWLKRVTVRCALMRMRVTARHEELSLSETSDVAAPTVDVATRLTIDGALARLSAPLRATFVLHEIEGYSHVEIAEMLGIRAGTSEVRLFRARALLRAMLEDVR